MTSERATADRPPRTCPSARCQAGAVLLGIVSPDGTVAYITPQVRVDQPFVDRARQGRTPEARFRFAQPCIESGCGTGSRTAATSSNKPSSPRSSPGWPMGAGHCHGAASARRVDGSPSGERRPAPSVHSSFTLLTAEFADDATSRPTRAAEPAPPGTSRELPMALEDDARQPLVMADLVSAHGGREP
jgi:hypothetical protein